jgi:hypothetical protein
MHVPSGPPRDGRTVIEFVRHPLSKAVVTTGVPFQQFAVLPGGVAVHVN